MYNKIMHWLNVFLTNVFMGYKVGKLIDAVVLGVMCIVIMLICHLPYAVMIGTLVGFTALIPVGCYRCNYRSINDTTQSPNEGTIRFEALVSSSSNDRR